MIRVEVLRVSRQLDVSNKNTRIPFTSSRDSRSSDLHKIWSRNVIRVDVPILKFHSNQFDSHVARYNKCLEISTTAFRNHFGFLWRQIFTLGKKHTWTAHVFKEKKKTGPPLSSTSAKQLLALWKAYSLQRKMTLVIIFPSFFIFERRLMIAMFDVARLFTTITASWHFFFVFLFLHSNRQQPDFPDQKHDITWSPVPPDNQSMGSEEKPTNQT